MLRASDLAEASCPFARWPRKAGRATAARIPMIRTTTISSMSVKPSSRVLRWRAVMARPSARWGPDLRRVELFLVRGFRSALTARGGPGCPPLEGVMRAAVAGLRGGGADSAPGGVAAALGLGVGA